MASIPATQKMNRTLVDSAFAMPLGAAIHRHDSATLPEGAGLHRRTLAADRDGAILMVRSYSELGMIEHERLALARELEQRHDDADGIMPSGGRSSRTATFLSRDSG
jgi:hypothetical protein